MRELFYDQIFLGNAPDIIDRLGHYETITAVKIIEHLEKDKGRVLIDKMLNQADLVILASPEILLMPLMFYE